MRKTPHKRGALSIRCATCSTLTHATQSLAEDSRNAVECTLLLLVVVGVARWLCAANGVSPQLASAMSAVESRPLRVCAACSCVSIGCDSPQRWCMGTVACSPCKRSSRRSSWAAAAFVQLHEQQAKLTRTHTGLRAQAHGLTDTNREALEAVAGARCAGHHVVTLRCQCPVITPRGSRSTDNAWHFKMSVTACRP